MPAMIGLIILTPFRSWKLFIAGMIIASVVIFFNWNTLIDIFYRPEVESTSTLRPLVWWDVIRMTLPRSPIFGLGLANYMYYWSDPTFVPISRIASGWSIWNAWGYAIPSHNMFVDVFAQTGILGTGFFLVGDGCCHLGDLSSSAFHNGFRFHESLCYRDFCILYRHVDQFLLVRRLVDPLRL